MNEVTLPLKRTLLTVLIAASLARLAVADDGVGAKEKEQLALAAARQVLLAELTAQLRSSKPAERATAANRLGNLGYREAGGDIARLLEDDDPQVRYFAIGTLMVLGVTDAAEKLMPFLDNAQKETRLLAADALLSFEYAPALPRLQEMLASEPVSTAALLAQRILLSGTVGAGPGLEKLLSSTEAKRRILAAFTLGNLEYRPAEASMALLLKDTEADVRSSGILSLGLLDPVKHAAGVRALLSSEETRDPACQVLARIQDAAAWEILWNQGAPRQGFLDLANFYTGPEVCKKLRATRFRLHELWRLELSRVLELAARKSGVPIEVAPASASLVSQARFGSNLGIIGSRPDVLSVLSVLNGHFLEGVDPQTRLTWIAEKEKVRLVTVEQAEAFWQDFARRQQELKRASK